MVIGVPSDHFALSAMVYFTSSGSWLTTSEVPNSLSSQTVPSVPKYQKLPNIWSATTEL